MANKTIHEWLKEAKVRGIDPLDAELILLHVLEKDDRTYLALHTDDNLGADVISECEKLVQRRLMKEPLAYILGFREFYGRKFFVSDGDVKTLIPRPESEQIIDIAKEIVPETILDVGAGSGVLALTLAVEIPEAKVVASDVFTSYSRIIEKNAKNLGFSEVNYAPKLDSTSVISKLTFVQSDLLDDIDFHFDLIVANLPYVDKTWDWIDADALDYEPSTALFADDSGLFLIKKLICQVKEKSASDYLILEADPCQFTAITSYASEFGLTLLEERGFQLLFRVD